MKSICRWVWKKKKKSKLSPWFMPYFSKMAQLIGLLSLVGIHPWLLLVLQWNIVECTRRHLKNECRDVSLLEIYLWRYVLIYWRICQRKKHQYFKSVDRKAKPEVWTHESFFSATFYTRRLSASPKAAASEKILRSDVDCFCWWKVSTKIKIVHISLYIKNICTFFY